MLSLNEDQSSALKSILTWVEEGDNHHPYFLLSGSAGTGKTYTISALLHQLEGKTSVIFTAPTNKAVKVLRDTLRQQDFHHECITIYSLLGLKMQPDGDVKKLKEPEFPKDISDYELVVVDEASMLNQVIMRFIDDAAKAHGVKFLFMGDPAQLPPVNESQSAVWERTMPFVHLSKVMRFDNQILELANELRSKVDHIAPSINLRSNNSGVEGVWLLSDDEFNRRLLSEVESGSFGQPGGSKAIAWRNITVDKLNAMIRQKMFDKAAFFTATDRIIVTEPVMADKQIIATTDEEGTVERVDLQQVNDIECYRLYCEMDDGNRAVFHVPTQAGKIRLSAELEIRATKAKIRPREWKAFWEYKERFHQIRHGYAITAHRSQGSTYERIFVDKNDILLNRNRNEAFRCLYVACTRAKKQLIIK